MQANIFSKDMLIGTCELSVTDNSMGVLGGVFTPNENYSRVQPVIWRFVDADNEQKDFEALKQIRLNVQLENGYFIFPLGGISIWDHPDCQGEPIDLDVAGVFRHVIEDFFDSDEASTVIQEPWEFLSIDQKLAFEDELRKEIGKKPKAKTSFWNFGSGKSQEYHKLVDFNFSAVATSNHCDDVLFAIHKPFEDNKFSFVVVHLTWKGGKEFDPKWPVTEFYTDFNEFRQKRMLPDIEDWED